MVSFGLFYGRLMNPGGGGEGVKTTPLVKI